MISRKQSGKMIRASLRSPLVLPSMMATTDDEEEDEEEASDARWVSDRLAAVMARSRMMMLRLVVVGCLPSSNTREDEIPSISLLLLSIAAPA